jgi:L-threonylcarbamoyladenylate synthase
MRQAAIPFWSPAEVEASLTDTASHQRAGRVLAYPTETVYGFGGAVDRDVERLVGPAGARRRSLSSRVR